MWICEKSNVNVSEGFFARLFVWAMNGESGNGWEKESDSRYNLYVYVSRIEFPVPFSIYFTKDLFITHQRIASKIVCIVHACVCVCRGGAASAEWDDRHLGPEQDFTKEISNEIPSFRWHCPDSSLISLLAKMKCTWFRLTTMTESQWNGATKGSRTLARFDDYYIY